MNNITDTIMKSKVSDLIINNSLTSELLTTHFVTSEIYNIETTITKEMATS